MHLLDGSEHVRKALFSWNDQEETDNGKSSIVLIGNLIDILLLFVIIVVLFILIEGIVVDAFAFHLVRDEVAARSPSSMGALAVPAMVEVTIRWLSLILLPVTSSAVTALIVGAITVGMT